MSFWTFWQTNHQFTSWSDNTLTWSSYTGKSLSEAFILTSTNPQYDKRLLIEIPVQYTKITSSEHVVYKNCSERQKKLCTQHVLDMFSTCSELGIFMCWIRNSMSNLLSYCGLVNTRICVPEKNLPVRTKKRKKSWLGRWKKKRKERKNHQIEM